MNHVDAPPLEIDGPFAHLDGKERLDRSAARRHHPVLPRRLRARRICHIICGPSRRTLDLLPGWSAQFTASSTTLKPVRRAHSKSSTSKPKPSIVICGKSVFAAAAVNALNPHWLSWIPERPVRPTIQLKSRPAITR